MIPATVIQTSMRKPSPHILEKVQQYFPGWNYLHFTDQDILEYFKANPSLLFPNAIERFHELPLGPWKADFFRYYYLYHHGGVYLDSDAMLHVSIEHLISDYDAVFIKSNFFHTFDHVFNGFIAVKPKHPIMLDALQHIYHVPLSKIKNYQFFCIHLLFILMHNDLTNIKVYQESPSHPKKSVSVILGIDGTPVLSHYFQSKQIPLDHF